MKTERNKWKIGFWIYFAISIIIVVYLFAKNSNNEVELAFSRIVKIQSEKDLNMISEIVNNTDLSKKEILSEIAKDNFYKIEKTNKDKIELEKTILVFETEKLVRIEKKKDALEF